MIHEQELKSWEEFDRIVKKRNYRQWIYRGHQDSSWELKSSLHRAFKDAIDIIKNGDRTKTLVRSKHENVMVDRFKSNAHLFLSHLPPVEDKLSWLTLMQHYGAPTRLLDFSFSPYIAAFFALEASTDDAAIYCVNHNVFRRVDKGLFGRELEGVYNEILSPEEQDRAAVLYAFEPRFSNQRLMAQQGVFLTPNTLKWSHEEILNDYDLGSTDIYRWIIPKKLRYEGVRLLRQKNIVSSVMYPGIEGFCKSFQHQPILDARLQQIVGS